jgi:hypothetical protein
MPIENSYLLIYLHYLFEKPLLADVPIGQADASTHVEAVVKNLFSTQVIHFSCDSQVRQELSQLSHLKLSKGDFNNKP